MRLHSLRALACLAGLLALPAAAGAQTGVSDDRVSLPEGPGSLEGIGDDLEIDPNMGMMSYAITFDVPDAWGGMRPSLALNYSSGAGASVAGLGWSFGMPAIERLTLRSVPRYEVDDEFTMGGEQLVYIGGSEPRVYRSRFERGFVRYKWFGHGTDGAGGYWVAEHPDGRVGYFGADASGAEDSASRVGDPALGVFRYGLVELRDVYDHRVVYTWDGGHGGGTTALVTGIAWGHDAAGTPNYTATLSYEGREDWISNANGGFEEVLDARLAEVDLTAHGTRIRRYAMVYEGYDVSGGFSRLAQVLLVGVDDTVYPGSSTFTYSRALGEICDGVSCERPFIRDMGTIDAVINTGEATLLDINGDALPDIVDSSQTGAHRVFLNTMSGDLTNTFASPYDSGLGTRAGHNLSLSQVQVLDANGDGFTDFMNASSGEILFNTGAGDWSSKETVWPSDASGLPTSEASLAALRFMDYDNDRKIDLIGSEGTGQSNITTIYRNMGEGFSVDDAVEPLDRGFGVGAMELNDFNGDGLLDAVTVGTTEVTYQLNLGWGRWSEPRTAGGFDFSTQQALDAEVEDINGDALADVVLVGSDTVTIWINKNGRELAGEDTLASDHVDGAIPTKGPNTVTLFADMNGNGTSDVVWITPGEPVRFLELFPVKPNLIASIDNGLGTTMDVSYGTSVEHMARDAAADRDWTYRVPFPNVVVDRIVESQSLTGVVVDQTFAYHDGYYDGVEKQFRGYESVEQAFVGSDFREAGELRMSYELGASPYDPYVAGNLVEREALSGDRSIQAVTQTFADCDVDGLGANDLRFDVRFVCMTQMDTELREGRPSTEWVVVRKTLAYDGYGNVVTDVDHGVVSIGGQGCGASTREAGEWGDPAGDDCLGDELYTETTYVTPDNTDGRWILSAPARERTYSGPGSDEYGETTTFYDGDAFAGLSEGQLTHGFPTRVQVRVDADTVMDAMRQERDAHGNAVTQLTALAADATGEHRTTVTWSDDGQRVVQTDMHLSNDDGPYVLRRGYVYDEVWDYVSVLDDWAAYRGDERLTPRNTQSYAYDAFGRPTSVVMPGGDTSGSPTVQHTYELGDPSRVITRRRSAVGGALDVEEIHCFDGRGREYQTKTKLAEELYQVSGYTVRAAGGDMPRRTYQPYTSTTATCDDAPPDGVLYQRTSFDALDRPILVESADGEGGWYESKLEYLPLETVEYEADDLDPSHPDYDTPRVTRVDGRGRTVAIGRTLTAGAEPQWYRFTYDGLDSPQTIVDPQGNRRTQKTDLLGRVIEVDDPDRGVITYTYDLVGMPTSRTDARGVTLRYAHDGASRLTAVWVDGDREATERTFTWDVAGDCPVGCEGTANTRVATSYPTPRGAATDYVGRDLRGRVTHLSRVLGDRTLTLGTRYDNADRPIGNTFPGALDIDQTVDIAGRVRAIDGFVTSTTNDDRGDVTGVTYANGVTVAQTFDARRLISGFTVTAPGATVVAGATFGRDVLGRIVSVADAAAQASGPTHDANYMYDAFSRLIEADLDLGRDEEEVLTYRYDSVDNILARESTGAGLVDDGTRVLDATRPHAVVQVGDTVVDYDAAGFVVTRGEQSFTWDGFGRFASVEEDGAEVASHSYGADDDRVFSVSAGTYTYFLGQGFEIVDGVGNVYVQIGDASVARHEYAAAATVVLSDLAPAAGADDALAVTGDDRIDAADAWLAWAHERGILTVTSGADAPSQSDELLAAGAALGLIDWGERTTWLHRNQIDSIVAVTDEDGAVVERSVDYPYGLPRWSSTNAPTPYAFTDKRTDLASGLVHIGSRQYDPLLGRWTAVDFAYERITDEDTMTGAPWEAFGGYSYIHDNPIEGQDENGANRFTDTGWQLINQALPAYIAQWESGAPSQNQASIAIASLNVISNAPIKTLQDAMYFMNFHIDEILKEGLERLDSGGLSGDAHEQQMELLVRARIADNHYAGDPDYLSRGFVDEAHLEKPSFEALPPRAPKNQGGAGGGNAFAMNLGDYQMAMDLAEDDIVDIMADEQKQAKSAKQADNVKKSAKMKGPPPAGKRGNLGAPPKASFHRPKAPPRK